MLSLRLFITVMCIVLLLMFSKTIKSPILNGLEGAIPETMKTNNVDRRVVIEEQIKTRIGLSSVRCSGETGPFGPSCKFTNVCLRGSSVFLTLQDDINMRPWLGVRWQPAVPLNETIPKADSSPFTYDRSQFQNGPRRSIGILSRTTGRSRERNFTFQPDIVSPSLLDLNISYHDELLIPISLFFPINAGHMVWDTLAPAFGVASYFGYDLPSESRPFRLLLLNHCDEQNDADILVGYPVEDCHRFVNGFLPLLSERQPIFLSRRPYVEGERPLCFSHAISGYGSFNAFNVLQNVLSGIGNRVLRNIFYSRLGLNTTRRMHGAIRLTVQIKRAGRQGQIMMNRLQVETFIKENFVLYKGYPIHVNIIHLDTTPISDQIRAFANTDIYFSTAGSGLYMSSLLTDDAIVIAVPKCHYNKLSRETTHLRVGVDKYANEGFFTCGDFAEIVQIQALSTVRVIPFPLRANDTLFADATRYNLPIFYLNETLHLALEGILANRQLYSSETSAFNA